MSGYEPVSHENPPGDPSPAQGSAGKITAAKNREEFAARLRELRIHAGSPSFRHLAKITNYSSSTLADATSGRRLPSESALKALVSACGADPAPWLEELHRLSAESAHQGRGPDQPAVTPERPPARWRPAAMATAVGLIIFGAGLAAGWADGGHERLPADGQITARWRT